MARRTLLRIQIIEREWKECGGDNEPSETYRVIPTTIRNAIRTTSTDLGASATKTPSPVATPLPPLNFSQMGYMWPRMANRAARAARR